MTYSMAIVATSAAPTWLPIVFIVLLGIVLVAIIAVIAVMVAMLRTLEQMEDALDKRNGWGKYAQKDKS